MPRPPTQPSFMQAQFEELAKQYQDLEAPELELQRSMSQTHNLNTLRDARVWSATSVRGSKHTRGKEQAPRHASTPVKPEAPQVKAPAQAQAQAPAQAQMLPPAPAQPHRPAPAYFPQPQAQRFSREQSLPHS